MSTSAYGLSPALIFFIRVGCEGVVSQRKFGTFVAYVAYTQQKLARKQRHSSLSSRVLLLGGEVLLSLQTQQVSCNRQTVYCSCLPPRDSGAWFALGEADIFPLLPSTCILAPHPGTSRWFEGTQIATPLWPHHDATCLLICLTLGSALLHSHSPCRVLPLPPTSPLPAPAANHIYAEHTKSRCGYTSVHDSSATAAEGVFRASFRAAGKPSHRLADFNFHIPFYLFFFSFQGQKHLS